MPHTNERGQRTSKANSTHAMLKSRKRSSRSDQALSRLSGHVDFSGKNMMQKGPVPKGDVGDKPKRDPYESKEDEGDSLAEGLARAAAVTPTRGKVGRIAKSALSMASAGAAIGKSYGDYKAKQQTAKAKRLSETPSQAVMVRKGQAKKVKSEKY